jgi:hypothetical protein
LRDNAVVEIMSTSITSTAMQASYYFLHVAVEQPTQAMLERRIEAWLKETFGVDVEFAVDKALAKLGKLGVLIRTGDRLAVPALDAALAQLDCVWSDFLREPKA